MTRVACVRVAAPAAPLDACAPAPDGKVWPGEMSLLTARGFGAYYISLDPGDARRREACGNHPSIAAWASRARTRPTG